MTRDWPHDIYVGRPQRLATPLCRVVGAALWLCVPATIVAQSSEAVLPISPEAAVSLALANNLNLDSARRTPEIAALNVRASESVWSPGVVATLGHSRADSPPSNSF